MISDRQKARNVQIMDNYAQVEAMATRVRSDITGERELPAVVFLNSSKKLTELAMSANASIRRETYAGLEDLYFEYKGIRYQCTSGRTM